MDIREVDVTNDSAILNSASPDVLFGKYFNHRKGKVLETFPEKDFCFFLK
jgi:hypothetical protein